MPHKLIPNAIHTCQCNGLNKKKAKILVQHKNIKEQEHGAAEAINKQKTRRAYLLNRRIEPLIPTSFTLFS